MPKRKEEPQKREPDPAKVDEMERLAIERANKAVSAIESAVAAWEASPKEDDEMGKRVKKLRAFYDVITPWLVKTLKTAGQKDMVGERLKRLGEYIEICTIYG